MPKTEADLFAFFDSHGIAHSTVEHAPFFTVEEGKDQWHLIPGLHCKNLFLKDHKDKIWLVVMPGDVRADLKALSGKIGSGKLSFGKPELLLEVLGITPGSVTPFALINDAHKRVTVVLDRTMLASERVNYHPLRNDKSTTIATPNLVKFVTALGYEPVIADCGGESQAA